MSMLRLLYHMARADFFERVRRYSFLVTLAGALYLAYAVAAEKIWIVVGNDYRGVYNSAWIGMLMTICCSTWLSLVGFYIVKNSVRRDTDTRVGQILAATPMRKDAYTLAKTLSNFAVLACMVIVLMVAAPIMQIMRGEAFSFSLWKLWSPFIFLALPTMFLTASVATLFETIPVLRGGVGNVAYFFLWTTTLALGANGLDDPAGLQLLYRSARNTLQTIDPTDQNNFHFSLTIGGRRAIHTFLWNGIDWNFRVLSMRVVWLTTGLAMVLVAALFFHRFDPSKEWFKRRGQKTPQVSAAPSNDAPIAAAIPISAAHLTPIVRRSGSSRFVRLVTSEILLMLKGQRWWWYIVAAGLLIAQFASPLSSARQGVLLAAWIWPILLWSQMGCRESRTATGPLLFSCERSLTRQLPALWLAGVAVAALTGAGVGLRLAATADWHGLAAWAGATVFIPSLALALGVWSGSSIPFEALYTIWWYTGPAHQMPGFDFIGTTAASSRAALYTLFALILLTLSYWGRRQRLAYA
jgi:hypothetical protein